MALAVGRLRGGRLADLGQAPFCRSWWLVVALAAQVALRTGVAPVVLLLGVAQIAPLVFAWANRRLPGMRLVAAGLALNTAVILTNGAMPVSGVALRALGVNGAVLPAGRHRLLEQGDYLPWLADVVPLPALGMVVSLGDVLLAVGVAVLVASLSAATPPSAPARRGA